MKAARNPSARGVPGDDYYLRKTGGSAGCEGELKLGGSWPLSGDGAFFLVPMPNRASNGTAPSVVSGHVQIVSHSVANGPPSKHVVDVDFATGTITTPAAPSTCRYAPQVAHRGEVVLDTADVRDNPNQPYQVSVVKVARNPNPGGVPGDDYYLRKTGGSAGCEGELKLGGSWPFSGDGAFFLVPMPNRASNGTAPSVVSGHVQIVSHSAANGPPRKHVVNVDFATGSLIK